MTRYVFQLLNIAYALSTYKKLQEILWSAFITCQRHLYMLNWMRQLCLKLSPIVIDWNFRICEK